MNNNRSRGICSDSAPRGDKGMGKSKSKKETNKDIVIAEDCGSEKIGYPYAEMVLQEIKDEYAVERAREDKIESKAATFLGAVIAILGLYIPSIPFENLKEFYDMERTGEKWTASVFLGILGIGIIAMIISFTYLQKVYGIKGHPRVKVKDLRDIAYRQDVTSESNKDLYRLGLIEHYYNILCGWEEDAEQIPSDNEGASKNHVEIERLQRILSTKNIKNGNNEQNKGNRDLNNDSAKLVRKGMISMIVSFVMITISTIGLRIVIVIPE